MVADEQIIQAIHFFTDNKHHRRDLCVYAYELRRLPVMEIYNVDMMLQVQRYVAAGLTYDITSEGLVAGSKLSKF